MDDYENHIELAMGIFRGLLRTDQSSSRADRFQIICPDYILNINYNVIKELNILKYKTLRQDIIHLDLDKEEWDDYCIDIEDIPFVKLQELKLLLG